MGISDNFIAEDLGFVTDSVKSLIEKVNLDNDELIRIEMILAKGETNE